MAKKLREILSGETIEENYLESPVRNLGFSYHPDNPNRDVLTSARKAGFKKTTKVVGLHARKLKRGITIMTKEGPIKAKKGDWFSIGAAGEKWSQSEKSLFSKYEAQGAKRIKGQNYYYFHPKPDQPPVAAAQIPHDFEVHTSWGKLKGKTGDYLLINHSDRYKRNPKDVWLVDKDIFEKTYK